MNWLGPRKEAYWLLGVLGFGLALRLYFVFALPDAFAWGDQRTYLADAGRMLNGEPYLGARGPATSASFALLHILGTDSLFGLRVAMSFMSILTLFGVWALGRELFSSRVGLIAAFWLAIHPRWATFPLYLFSEHLYTICVLGSVFFASRFLRRGEIVFALASGAILGLGILTREVLLYMLPAMACVIAWLHPPSRRHRLIGTAAFILSATVIVAPWTIRNYRVYDAFVPVGFSSGIPLFEGNYIGDSAIEIRQERNGRLQRYLRATGGSAVGADRLLKADAWQIIVDRQPTWVFEKIVSNIPLIFQPDVTRPEAWWFVSEERRATTRQLLSGSFLFFHFFTLVLGIVGLSRWRLRGPESLSLLFLVFSIALHVAANAGISRFQLPYEWVLGLSGASLVHHGQPFGRARKGLCLVLLATLLLSQIPVRDRWLVPSRDTTPWKTQEVNPD